MKSRQEYSVHFLLNGSVLLLIWSVLTTTAYAAPVAFGDVIPGAGTVTKNVISMRERRYADVTKQTTDYSCGAAALATILKYAYDWPVTEDEVIKGMLEVSNPKLVRERGFSLLDIKNYLEMIAMRGRGYRVGYNDLKRVRVPTIVLLDIHGYRHFVVLKETTDKSVYLADPALGNRTMSRAEFLQGWNGIVFAVIGHGFERDTVLLDRKEPPTVRRRTLQAPLSDAELYEFGFKRADVF